MGGGNASIEFSSILFRQAFQSVRENHGCAGVDGVTIDGFAKDLSVHLAGLRREMLDGTYRPLPLLKILVAKKNGEPRGLCIPTVRDRVAQTALLQQIAPVLEKEFEECSYAYRKGRSVRQAVLKIKEHYERGYCWVVDADIDAFFDTVDHELMLAKFAGCISDPRVLSLIEMWLRAEIWDGTSVFELRQGLPQGSPLSPVLANLFLDELDEAMLARGYKIIRYADDYVVLCKTRTEAQAAKELSEQVLAGLLLRLDEGEIVSFAQGFTYLGVTFMNSLIMTPYERPKWERKVLFYPPPLDVAGYLRRKGAGFRGQGAGVNPGTVVRGKGEDEI